MSMFFRRGMEIEMEKTRTDRIETFDRIVRYGRVAIPIEEEFNISACICGMRSENMAVHEIRDMTRLNLDRWNRLGDDAANALEFLDDEFEIDGT